MPSLVYDDIDPEALKSPPRRKVERKNPRVKRDFAIPQLKAEPRSPTDVMNNLVARELMDPSGELEETSPTVHLYGSLLRGIARGEDITPIREQVKRITEHQPEKADLLLSVLNLIDQERTEDFVVVRAATEKVIKRAAQRGDINTQEALVVYSMASRVIAENRAQLIKNVKPVEGTTLDKVENHGQKQERLMMKKWEGTSPQGREIIRKKLYELKQQVITEERVIETEEEAPSAEEVVDV